MVNGEHTVKVEPLTVSAIVARRNTAFHKLTSNTENTSFEVTEAALVRDVIYAIQGIDGKYLKFDFASDMYKIDATVSVLSHIAFLFQSHLSSPCSFNRFGK
jgi:hypothetical protein